MIRGSKSRFPYHEGHHLIVALRQFVYADESGIHEGAKVCLIAGYRGSPSQWARFDKDWRVALAKHGVKEFHSNIFFNRKVIKSPEKNPYLKWSDAKARQYLGELLMAIRKRRIRPVGCAVVVRDFDSYSWGERAVMAGYGELPQRRKLREQPVPYHLAFYLMMGDVLQHVDERTEIELVLAEHDEYLQQAHQVYQLTKSLNPAGRVQQFRRFTAEVPADQSRLQAADLFVGRWYNTLSRGRAKLNEENIYVMNQLCHNRQDMPIMDRAHMERWFAGSGVTERQRRALRQETPS